MEKSYSFMYIMAGEGDVAVNSGLASSEAFNPDAVTIRLMFGQAQINVTFDNEAAFTCWYDQIDREWRMVQDSLAERDGAARIERLQVMADETFRYEPVAA